jgi:F420-non-reducing hydrogenase iron-sulfur subunit
VKDEDVQADVLFLCAQNEVSVMKGNGNSVRTAIFFCRRIDRQQDTNRRALEREMGDRIKFFPLPCSGRIEALHLLRAIEAGAQKVFVITCPEGTCRYGQGNLRARKRVDFAKTLIQEIGLDPESIQLLSAPAEGGVTIDALTRQILDAHDPKDGYQGFGGGRAEAAKAVA